MALGLKRLARPAGWFTIVVGFSSCIAPGALLALGKWDTTPQSFIVSFELAPICILFFGRGFGNRSGIHEPAVVGERGRRDADPEPLSKPATNAPSVPDLRCP